MANQDDESKPDDNKLPTAKWGAACSACATAKAKCIRSNPGPNAKCDSRTAQIEERLNGLVNLLQASGELNNNQSALGALSDVAAREHSAITHDTPSTNSTASYMPHSSSWRIPETYNCYAIPACICRPEPGDAPRDAPPPPDSDDVLLELYRTQMLPVFPFVVIPPSISASELRSNRPFLMSAIRMVTSFRSLRSMRAQMYRLMSHIADYVLIRSARSLELLQGVMIMISWHQYHCLMHGQMNNLIALAMSLVVDLGLNWAPGLREQARLMVARPDEPPGRTNEERRALLGVWFLTCNISVSFNRVESLKYTAYIQDCMNVLENSREYESDITLLYLVRVQRLTERIFELNSKDKAVEDIPGLPSAPMSAYIAAFQNEIETMRNTLPPNLQNDGVFLSYLNTAMLRLYEPHAVDLAFVNSLSQSLTAGPLGRGTPLDKLYQSSAALRNWFDSWLSVPASSYFRHPTTIMSQLVYAITMLGRWAQLATPRTVYEGGTPMPLGEGSSAYNADSQMGTNGLSESKSFQGYNQGDQKPRCGESVDQDLIAALAGLQSQLQSQPGLTINIPEILSSMCSKCEQVNNIFQQTAPEEEKMDNNVWTFSALKVRITRVKLERWAELVAAAAEGHDRLSKAAHPQEWRGSYPQTSSANMGQPPNGMANNGFAQDQTQIQNFLDSTPWTSDLLNGIDPTVWFDGYLDWGTLVMNSMGQGPVGQQPQI
ncbi:Winged helix-turn-helix transcription repressor DNA-binding protein [Metarhizium robertsii ARSEF 23]|uniref:Winged helix-turn-helix transcription repressor DNA-binding protein n=1 Tax=Metarhizium robertsii (strain ARSEF 23 / ATCC MYA-3075) TaxID=655844 RepID=A0A0B2XID3_METRA|nr:Winged helix-turn-helix transcription repressor DNA-binding protein [Metarhizium robertsii ARSEF 23]KHO11616.1 Winged helix-turn-helix transcription repressor DNA-binding protein [Metarhizium robertsii ARSEF 23]